MLRRLAAIFLLLFAGRAFAVTISPCAKTVFLASTGDASDSTLSELQALRHRLESRLGIFRDPFAFLSSLQDGISMWKLLKQKFPSLMDVSESVAEAHRNGGTVPDALERRVMKEINELLALDQKQSDNDTLAGALRALMKLEEIHARDLPPANQPPPEPDQKQKEEEKEKKKKEKTPPKPPNPDFPDPMKSYQAGNVDTDNSGGEATQRVAIARVNKAKVAYFRMAYFQIVDAMTNRWAQVASTEPRRVQVTRSAPHHLQLYPHAKKEEVLPVLIPQGFEPFAFKDSDSEVFQDDSGNWYYYTTKSEVRVPLFPQGESVRPLSPPERELYSQAGPVPLSAWPDHLRHAVEQLRDARERGAFSGPDADVKLAKVLGSYIANHFLYRVDKDDETSAVTLAHKGAIQCSTATTILVSLLRTEFGIACRAVGGYRGSETPGEIDASYVISPAFGHAWAEIADELGNWHGVDPTPHKKDREVEKPDTESDKWKDIQESSSSEAGEGEGAEKQEGAFDGTPSDNKDDEGKSLKDLISQTVAMQKEKERERRAKAEQDAKDRGEGSSPGAGQGNKEGDDKEIVDTKDRKLDKLISDLDTKNPFTMKLIERLIAWAVSTKLTVKEKRDRIHSLKAILGNDADGQFPWTQKVKDILSEATLLFTGDKPAFDRWIESLFKVDIEPNKFVDEINQIERHLRFTATFLHGEERAIIERLRRSVLKLRREFGKIRHPDSTAIRLAIELDEGLPGNISRGILKERFGLDQGFGDNLATLEMAKAISSGTLNDYRLMSILGPHTEFLVDPILTPAKGERKTWDPSLKRKGRSDILLTNDPRLPQRVRLYEHLTDEEALARGEMGVIRVRKRVSYPIGFTDLDPEKATVILLDTSGSMSGDNAFFQSMYVAALVDRALSDVTPGGKARHRVYIGCFDTKVHTEIEVTSVKQALDFMKTVKRSTGNTSGGTNIEEGLVWAAGKLKTASDEGDKALARGNVIVCSDGGSSVNKQNVINAFDAVGNDTDILLAFNAIGGTNSVLYELTHSELGTEKSMYLEWTTNDIARVLSDSRAPAVPINDFWTKENWANLPSELRRALGELQRATSTYRGETAAFASKYQANLVRLQTLRKETSIQVEGRPDKRSPSHYGKLAGFLRALNLVGPHLSAEDRGFIFAEIIEDWPKLVPEPVRQLDHQELACLGFMLNWPATGFAGERPPR